jgi:hypothetical protein
MNPTSDNTEFRDLLARVQWDTSRFARAAGVRKRNAEQMYHDERPVPPRLMDWLRDMAEAAERVPPVPN